MAQQPPPLPVPQPNPPNPQGLESVRVNKLPIDKICKYGAEEFCDEAHQWWNTLIAVGYKIVAEYKREFVQLSKYARECIPSKVFMCTRFEKGLNKDIQLLAGILKLKEFVVLVERAHKAEELSKAKRKTNSEFET
ncbi:Retrotransposon gag domain-containing 1 [Gossypium australe]|uniref:Retrotransposon gag domain-containing 1 n=1 Tax=Gossypium australe TaxID=47621 RepID=A0A5B6X274_9ROSI|nr:Retrotransposon gag domain-containing 1 [Gossypium australe]